MVFDLVRILGLELGRDGCGWSIVDGYMDEVHGMSITSSLTTFRDNAEAPWYESTEFFFNYSIFPLRSSTRIHLNSIRALANNSGR
jgi:hypothetical protein